MENANVAVEQYKSEQALKSAASWFTWIGALSIINSAVTMNDSDFAFTFGLGISQIGDGLMASGGGLAGTLGLFLSFGFSGLFVLLGWLAKHWEPAFATGLVVYSCDSIIFMVVGDWIGVGFHVFAAVMIIVNYKAYRKMRSAAAAVPVPAAAEVAAPV